MYCLVSGLDLISDTCLPLVAAPGNVVDKGSESDRLKCRGSAGAECARGAVITERAILQTMMRQTDFICRNTVVAFIKNSIIGYSENSQADGAAHTLLFFLICNHHVWKMHQCFY